MMSERHGSLHHTHLNRPNTAILEASQKLSSAAVLIQKHMLKAGNKEKSEIKEKASFVLF